MTNPNNAIGTNGAYGGRTSVNAFNDDLALYNGRGRLSGFVVSPDSGMTVSLGGDGSTRDVAIAEDNTGNKTTINNISGSPISVSIDAAPASNSRIDAIVTYVDNPPQGTSSAVDNPAACGLIVVKGTVASSPTPPTEAMIRTAITADGASGTTAFYVIVGYVRVPNGTTDITGNLISQGPLTSISASAIQTGAITTAKIANNAVTTAKIPNGAVTNDKLDVTTLYEYAGSGHGESGPITLSAPFTDFKYVDVFAENLDGGITSTRVLGNTTISYINVIDYYNNAVYLKTAQFRVSGTSFTWHHNNYQMKITSTGAVEITSNAKWGILKIVGYK